MRSRSLGALALGVLFACAIATACADKVFRPVTRASSKVQLQVSTTGAQQVSATGQRQILVVAVAYKTNDTTGTVDDNKMLRILAGPLVVSVTGASQAITVSVDLTTCLADGQRQGSQTACSLYYAAFLHDSATFSIDTSDITQNAYDVAFVGPIDVSPGNVPVLAPITLSHSAFSVYSWAGDESLRLGGPLSQTQFNGPMAGTVTGLTPGAPPVLFTLTQGFTFTGGICTTANPNACGFNSAQLAIFQNNSWTRVNGPSGTSQFNDVAAFSPTDVYLAGQGGIYHYDGTSISLVSGTSGENVVSIGAVTSNGSKYVVAGTSSGNAWFGNTTSFQKSPVTTNGFQIDGVCVTGPNEAFGLNSSSGTLFRFNGTSWTAAPAIVNGAKADLQCPSPGVAFVSVTGVGIIGWNGSTWTAIPPAPRAGRTAVVSANEVYVAADSGTSNRNFYKYNGSSWSLIGTSYFVQTMQGRPWADPRGGAAYFHSSSSGRIDVATVSGSHPVSYGTSIRDVIMTSASNAFAVGWNMFLARWNGTTWTVDKPPAGTVDNRILAGVWSDGPSNGWAVGNAATILHFDGTKWNLVSDVNHPVAAVDNYNAVWGSGSDVWLAGGNGVLHCRSVTACSQDPVSGIDSLYGIWGTSNANAWAVGSHGKIMHYDGTQWTSVATPTSHRLVRLWGSSAANIWAVGDSALVHYDGTSWADSTGAASKIFSSAPPSGGLSNSFNLGLWGNGTKDLYVSTYFGQIYHYDGAFWSQMTLPGQGTNSFIGRITAISGYSGGCPIAVIDGQNGSISPTLLRGVGPTGCGSSPMPVTTPWP
jgi:hypothetical protein